MVGAGGEQRTGKRSGEFAILGVGALGREVLREGLSPGAEGVS